MNSRIIGLSDLSLPTSELEAILNFNNENTHYSEFHFGDWQSYVIWNQTGIDDDGVVIDRGLQAKPSPRGRLLHALNGWIETTFDVTTLKLARVHSLGDGVLVPHRDFVEFRTTPWTRIHVPLMTNPNCLHSEGETVFHMRPNEIWFLDASNLHSAINYSAGRRINLCLDFELNGHPVESAFRKRAGSARPFSIEPEVVERMPLGPSFNDELRSLSMTLKPATFDRAVGLLSKVHFFRNAHVGAFFDWLLFVAEHSRDPSLRSKAEHYVRFLRDERAMGDRFALHG